MDSLTLFGCVLLSLTIRVLDRYPTFSLEPFSFLLSNCATSGISTWAATTLSLSSTPSSLHSNVLHFQYIFHFVFEYYYFYYIFIFNVFSITIQYFLYSISMFEFHCLEHARMRGFTFIWLESDSTYIVAVLFSFSLNVPRHTCSLESFNLFFERHPI